ncbi:hypothetical protein CDAR_440151 [Caerostris darwini]|uniref:Uncharacterized protein n=1 Tax=Caerostris darwini TaxID=1538125 RepID=A0AAV4RNE3_9ARAC|nr:hypothetical protein CDAR_440151 [Caerostris darwini]
MVHKDYVPPPLLAAVKFVCDYDIGHNNAGPDKTGQPLIHYEGGPKLPLSAIHLGASHVPQSSHKSRPILPGQNTNPLSGRNLPRIPSKIPSLHRSATSAPVTNLCEFIRLNYRVKSLVKCGRIINVK